MYCKVTLLSLWSHVKPLLEQLNNLAILCNCDPKENDQEDIYDITIIHNCETYLVSKRILSIPKGSELLSYWYEATLNSLELFKPVMLSLFKSACDPFLKWITDWIFYGTLKVVNFLNN